MTVIDKLASSLNRRDEIPNQDLAKDIVAKKDQKAVKELVDNLNNKREIQNDCIKVLYEIGERMPHLIANHYKAFIKLLNDKNNRLQWGAMTALSTITNERPKEVYSALTEILMAADRGSVITKDNAFNILIKLCAIKEYKSNSFPILIDMLQKSPYNQFPMYVERAMIIVDKDNKYLFIKVLMARLSDIGKESKRKRVEKVIRKLNKK